MIAPAGHAGEAALATTALTVAYDGEPVVWNANVRIGRGRLAAIVGPNGAGKSTLLKAILGLVPRLAGSVELLGDPLLPTRAGRRANAARYAYVPQRTDVDWDFPATVLDVVVMGTYGRLGWFKRPGPRERQDALDALARVEMTEFRDRQISELSGGQQQRVFLARALVHDADVLLMDEPFAGVDAVTERSIVELLRSLRDRGKSIVAVHHDLATVAQYFDDVVLLNREVIAQGPVGATFTPDAVERTYGAFERAAG